MAKCPKCKGFGYVNRFGSFDGSMEMQCPRCHGMFFDPHASPKISNRGGSRASGGNGGSILLLLALAGGWFWIQSHFGGMDAFKDSAASTIEKVFAFLFYGIALPGIVLVNLIVAFAYAKWRYWNLPRWILNCSILLVFFSLLWWAALAVACGLFGWTVPAWLIRNAALVLGGGSALIALVNVGEHYGEYGHAWDLVLIGNAKKTKRILRALMPLSRGPKGLRLPKDAMRDPFVSTFCGMQAGLMVMAMFPGAEKDERLEINGKILKRFEAWGCKGRRRNRPALSGDTVAREQERGRYFGVLFYKQYHSLGALSGAVVLKDEFAEWVDKNTTSLREALGEARWRDAEQRRAYLVESCWKPELERLNA